MSLLGDVCALPRSPVCMMVLEQGLCGEISKLAQQGQSMLIPELTSLFKQSIFLLSNIVADQNPHVLRFLTASQVYPLVLIPMFKWPQCPIEIQLELAFCIGNVFIAADFIMIKYFIEVGFLELLVTSLQSQTSQLVAIALTALRKLFRKTRKYQ